MKVHEQVFLLSFVLMSFVYNMITKVTMTHNIFIVGVLYLLSQLLSTFIRKRYNRLLVSPLGLLNFLIVLMYNYFINGSVPYYIYGFLGAITPIMIAEYRQFSKVRD